MKYPRIEKMKVADIRPATYNPREITDDALRGLGESIDRFGIVELPVVNKRTGNLVGGHQRLKVMTARGTKSIDVVVVDVDEIEEKALNVSLNNPEIAGTFTKELQDVLAEIAEHDDIWMDTLNLSGLIEVEEPEPSGSSGSGDNPADDIVPSGKRKSFNPGQKKKVGRHTIVCSDCVSHLRTMADNSVDSIVTDPPYGIGFMGKEWDVAVPGIEWAKECLRVLKPGGHIIAFAATRTVHRLAVAIEDAGFEIRDTISWLYWSGFPKSLNVSLAIDNASGTERKVVGVGRGVIANPNKIDRHTVGGETVDFPLTVPTSDAAKQWDGWGTALKPAQEPAILARKPLIGTVANNVLAHGTGGINVDACRIEDGDASWPGPNGDNGGWGGGGGAFNNWVDQGEAGFGPGGDPRKASGRFPANIYVCPKPAGSEKAAGLDGYDEQTGGEATDRKDRSKGLKSPRAGAGRNGGAKNFHPTVKPVRIMRWLIRLVTPPGGIVVDTFLGSGTTMVAAEREGFACIGIEMSGEFAALSEARVKNAVLDSTSE